MKKTCLRYLPGALFLALAAIALSLPHAALAAGPEAWKLGLQPPGSPTMDRIYAFHNQLMYTITAIVVFVFALMFWVVVRYNKWVNPVPSKRTHNLPLEVLWSTVPVLILLTLFIPSMKLLYYGDRTATPDMTLKITGYQWYWGYEYPNEGELAFTSYLIKDKDIDPAKGQKRLLSVDNPVVLPVDTNIQLLITASDVIHSFALPALGVKLDAVPGRLNETWVRIEKPGVYYGECSELCGQGHGFMPIEIHAVSKEEYREWLVTAKKQFASAAAPSPFQLAKAQAFTNQEDVQ
jgi:cytochrome c oxidase subunit 2